MSKIKQFLWRWGRHVLTFSGLIRCWQKTSSCKRTGPDLGLSRPAWGRRKPTPTQTKEHQHAPGGGGIHLWASTHLRKQLLHVAGPNGSRFYPKQEGPYAEITRPVIKYYKHSACKSKFEYSSSPPSVKPQNWSWWIHTLLINHEICLCDIDDFMSIYHFSYLLSLSFFLI